MKKLFYFFAVAALVATLVACESHELENQFSQTNNENEAVIAKQNNYNEITSNLASIILSDIKTDKSSTLKSITEAAYKKIDGDNDVLVVEHFSRSLKTRSTVRELDQMLFNIQKTYPLLNIYCPFEYEDFEKEDDFLIIINPEYLNDAIETELIAFNKNGNIVKVSSKIEPEHPFLVIGTNERFEIVDKTNLSSTRFSNLDSDLYYETDNYKYYLPKQYNSNSTTRTTYRDENDISSVDYIEWAKFVSKAALQRVEGYTKGMPEVALIVGYLDPTDPSKYNTLSNGKDNVIFQNLEGKWYTGSRTWLRKLKGWSVCTNYGSDGNGFILSNWIKTVPTRMAMIYLFEEKDSGFSAKLNTSLEFSNKVKAEIKLDPVTASVERGVLGKFGGEFTIVDGHDQIGYKVVSFHDDLSRPYRISDMFEFKLSLTNKYN